MKLEAYHNWELERAIRESGQSQEALAKEAGIDPGILTYIKRGRMRPTDDEEKRLALALKLPVEKLFIRTERANQ